VHFGKSKSQIGQCAKALVTQLKAEGCDIKCLRCDPGGENRPMEVFCKEQGITQEITAANTPQQNGVVERKSAGQLGLASDVVHLSWGAGQWSLFVLLQTTPRGPWLAVHVRTLALKNGEVMRLTEL
jgi:hypothetical protein